AHRGADAVRGEPRGLVAARQDLPELARGRSRRALDEEVHRDEPLPERQVRAVEERPGRDAELVAARAAEPPRARLGPGQTLRLAAPRALRSGRPAQRREEGAAPILERADLARRDVGEDRRQVLGCNRVGHLSTTVVAALRATQ